MNTKIEEQFEIELLKWDSHGLLPAIVQDDSNGQVLMMAWMNPEALTETIDSGKAVYWSRSRSRLWRKGESSGHEQKVVELRTDCDMDVILLRVEQHGGIACHTGRAHCFYRKLESGNWILTEYPIKTPEEIYSV